MRTLAVLLTITLLFTWTAAAYADARMGPDQIIEVTPSGFRYKETIDPKGKSRIIVVKERIISLEEYRRIVNLASVQAGTGYVENKSWTANPEVAGIFSRYFNDSGLFLRGFKDVWAASGGGMFSEQGNLNDPAKRYDFWQEQGIYDKYSLRERAYLNKVVFPAVAVSRALYGGGAIALTATAVASLAGVAVLPLILGGVGVWAGLTAIKAWQVKNKNADVAGLPQFFGGLKSGQANWYAGSALGAVGGMTAGIASLLRGAIGNPVLRVAANGSAALAEGIGLGTAVAGVGSATVGGYIGASESFNVVRLINEWGIPEKTTLTDAEFVARPYANQSEKREVLEFKYRLIK